MSKEDGNNVEIVKDGKGYRACSALQP